MGMIQVDEDLFDSLLKAKFIDVELAEKEPPTFKPNKKLGEGIAPMEELAYRKELLNKLKALKQDVDTIITSNDHPDLKIIYIDQKLEAYKLECYRLIDEHTRNAYTKGMDMANKRTGRKVVNIEGITQDRLQHIIQTQQDSIEDQTYKLRGKLIKLIRLREFNSANDKAEA